MSRPAVAALAAAVASTTYAALRRRPPAGRARWERVNYRGRQVSLVAGPAVAAGAVAAAAVTAPGPALLAGGGAGAFGLLDDLTGATHARGFGGHLAALRRGEVTTGMVKLAGIGASALAAALLARRPVGDTLVDTALVAGTANLVNLLDLRPGRALKATALVAAPLSVGRGPAGLLAAAPFGAAAALLGPDLREQAMIGDCGANALGALLGLAVARRSRPARVAALAGVVALTAASERVSFSAVIDRTPALATVDRLGRLPADAG